MVGRQPELAQSPAAARTLAKLPVSRSQAAWLTTTIRLGQGGRTRDQVVAGDPAPAPPSLPPHEWRQYARRSYRLSAVPDWPVLGRLHSLAAPAQAGEPAAFQVLRGLPATQAGRTQEALTTLPSLGPGDPLAPGIRRPLEMLLGRDFTHVRVHTAVAAEALGAEAFTTGRHIVFAPGRLDLHSARGVALLGHELAHVGQTLAFKQRQGADMAQMDGDEQQARQQEASLQQIMSAGWPTAPSMQVRRLEQPAPNAVSGSVGIDGAQIQRMTAHEESALPIAHLHAVAGPLHNAMAALTGSELDALARQVYGLLKARLRAERDRQPLYR